MKGFLVTSGWGYEDARCFLIVKTMREVETLLNEKFFKGEKTHEAVAMWRSIED